ncbi:acyltransferase family protein [Leptospira sanjuanensis]|uniref:acyltransferase family protein n=1 Tax=Leptospira sanjuanensis TaxID=2879643 RepID=UPI001EE7F66C|nr:acyltransferase [Leptospira sanjuanensis]MCG6166539.1 acyltransferase [Leptospira sanjuanensis]
MKQEAVENKKEEILPLNGLRAFAITAVFVYHYYFYSGYTAANNNSILQAFIDMLHHFEINLFLILSGFLISMALWKEWSEKGRISYLDFFLKRNYKLLPVYYIFITISYVINRVSYTISQKWIATKELTVPETLMALNVMESADNGLRNAWADFVFLGNYFKGPNIHTWFLSMIEQFYIFFPLFCGFILFKRDFFTRQCILWVLYFIPVLFRVYIYLNPNVFGTDYEILVFRPTHTRMDSIIIGVILMDWVVNRSEFLKKYLTGRIVSILLMLLPIGILVFINIVSDSVYSFFSGTVRFNLIDFVYISVLLSVMLFPNTLLARGLSLKLINPVANLSYTIYIWHLLLSLISFGTLKILLPDLFETGLFFFVISLLISYFFTIGICWLIHRYVENPLGRVFKRIFPLSSVSKK